MQDLSYLVNRSEVELTSDLSCSSALAGEIFSREIFIPVWIPRSCADSDPLFGHPVIFVKDDALLLSSARLSPLGQSPTSPLGPFFRGRRKREGWGTVPSSGTSHLIFTSLRGSSLRGSYHHLHLLDGETEAHTS